MAAAGKKISGTTVHIGTTATDGSADTYQEIGRCTVVGGSVGYAWQMADSTAVSDTVKQSTKTIKDASDVDLEWNEIAADAGQVALKSAADDGDTDLAFNFEVRFPQGDKWRFKAKVTSYGVGPFNATGLRKGKAKCMLTAAPAYVAAT